MKNNTVDDDRWESLPPPRAASESVAGHSESSPDTCVFGAASARPRPAVVGMPARVSLRAQAIVDSFRPEAVTPSTSPGPFAPVAGMAMFEDDSEVSDIGVFRRSAILRPLAGGLARAPRRSIPEASLPAVTVVAPVRNRRAVAIVVLAALLATPGIVSLSWVQRAIRETADVVVTLLFAAT